MSEQKKLVPSHQKKITLFHKSGTAHEFEPVDAKEVLAQPTTEYARELSFWEKLQNAVENIADTATAVIETATAVQDQIEDLSDAVKPKKKG